MTAPVAAHAKDPGRWKLASTRHVPLAYNQGVTTTATGQFAFTSTNGIFRTSRTLHERAIAAVAIPPDVSAAEGYDHVGDPSYDRHEDGRLLLPLECYKADVGNHCGTGSIGVADPATLKWRYYVKLDPRYIEKAMWVETRGNALWTQAGSRLLRYDLRQVRRRNAAPTGEQLKPTKTLRHALPPGEMDGAAFIGRRLYVSTQGDDGRMRLYSINLRTGKRRLEVERAIHGESEGITGGRALGGTLHWVIAPFDPKGRPPTFGPDRCALLTFRKRRR